MAGVACVGQTTSSTNSGQTSQVSRPTPQFTVDDSRATRTYANFSRVTGTPEELIIDFGLNPEPIGTPTAPIAIDQRVIVSFYTAKRLAAALQMSIERHEQIFGVIETDIQKRIKGKP
jgi:hypothetical protein